MSSACSGDTAGSVATAAARSGGCGSRSPRVQATASRPCRRAPDIEAGNQAQRGGVLDRLVRRAVFAEADGVVREHVDHALLHQRRHADGVAAVVAEGEEGAAVGDEAAVQRHAVHDRGHAELAHAVVDVAAAVAAPSAPKRSAGVAGVGEVGAGQVGAAAEQLGQRRVKTSSASWLALRLATVSALAVGGGQRLGRRAPSWPAARRPCGGGTRRPARVGGAVGGEARPTAASSAPRAPWRPPGGVGGLGDDEEGLAGPAERGARQLDLRRPAPRRAPWRCRRGSASPCRWWSCSRSAWACRFFALAWRARRSPPPASWPSTPG